jgi:hypothetical protein
VVIVPSDQAARSGLLPDQVKVSEKYGGGYPANVEGLHHLHCLVGGRFSNLTQGALIFNILLETAESASPVALLQL